MTLNVLLGALGLPDRIDQRHAIAPRPDRFRRVAAAPIGLADGREVGIDRLIVEAGHRLLTPPVYR